MFHNCVSVKSCHMFLLALLAGRYHGPSSYYWCQSDRRIALILLRIIGVEAPALVSC